MDHRVTCVNTTPAGTHHHVLPSPRPSRTSGIRARFLRAEMRGALPPSGFSRCSGDDHAILPASVRAIADTLAHGDDLALLEKLGGVCLRTAVEEYVTLLAAGVQTDELFVALGRVRDGRGMSHDHAWILQRHAGQWKVRDHAAGVRAHEPLVLLSNAGIWTTQPAQLLPALHPGFFLTMHCQINDEALAGLRDASMIDDINHMNACVDNPLAHPNYDPREHFDNALILESILLLEDRLAGDGRLHTIHTGVAPAIPHGLACHAVADFYSHSNYAPMALAYYKAPERVLPIDQALKDPSFIRFATDSWENTSMWRDYEGYSTTKRFSFGPGFERSLFTGGYGGDGWTPREGIPHHNDFAVDQPDFAWVHAEKILPRRHPFAFPGTWGTQYALRYRLAVDHLRRVLERAQSSDPTPFLGQGQTLPNVLVPQQWTLPDSRVVASRSFLVRGADGRPEEIVV